MENKIVCGIYKITSPSGRVYIGQSKDVFRLRVRNYKKETCHSQPLLERSLKKYGWENHTFEIIEECEVEDLNCRERHWQDFYDVLNGGLNCVLQECGELKYKLSENTKNNISISRITKETAKKGNNGNAKKVINYKTFVTFDCAKDLSIFLNINYSTLMSMLCKNRFNSTDWCFIKDYEDKSYLSNIKPKTIDSGNEIICTISLQTWRNATICAKDNNLKPSDLIRYLNPNNNRKNKTSFIYLKDYKE
jgi:hypothetical protein